MGKLPSLIDELHMAVLQGSITSINSKRTSVGMGFNMQVFGGERNSTRRTLSIVYSLKAVNCSPQEDVYVVGISSGARTASILVLKKSDTGHRTQQKNTGNNLPVFNIKISLAGVQCSRTLLYTAGVPD